MKILNQYKKLMLLATVTFLFSFNEESVNWMSLEEVMKQVQSAPKPVVIDFTASWCGWCKKMDQNTFSREDVASYMNEKFYPVRLDYDSKEQLNFFGEKFTARELADKYRVPGLPTILIISADQKKSKKLVGYKTAEPFLAKLKSF